ncbi:hypothetical protein [Chitinophaga filiformis]|uniref:Helix-turn-helix n=1 Tax=Chitinophaga filiformis TaxID=104663 RepID=A0ABY4HW32_CHIFI|nr:hypothetical protein [Chitinophaga filiformis]UPK67983.1 hypothetical protein MYF79_23810 [Chitinophaga filiformis]
MKSNVSTIKLNAVQGNVIQEKISLLCNNGFTWREISALTDLPKKLIRLIAKGNYAPNKEETHRLEKIFDDTIERLRIGTERVTENTFPEADFDAEDHVCYKLDVKSVTLYKGTYDDKMIVQIHGIILHS